MLYILGLIIILYTVSHLLFKQNPVYLKIRKYIDIATLIVTSVLVIAWVELFNYSFLFLIYFFVSLGVITFLVSRLRKIEVKKQKAENVIRVLKNEELVLENEIDKKDNQIEILQNEKSS